MIKSVKKLLTYKSKSLVKDSDKNHVPLHNLIKLSILICTKGRITLFRLLDRLKELLNKTDQAIVVIDLSHNISKSKLLLNRYYDNRYIFYEYDHKQYSNLPTISGNAQRDWALQNQICCGTHIMFMDDDDMCTLNSLDIVRQEISIEPNIPHIFPMKDCKKNRIYNSGIVKKNRIGGPMFVIPNNPILFGRWEPWGRRCSDWEFIKSTLEKYNNQFIYHKEPEKTIYLVRPK